MPLIISNLKLRLSDDESILGKLVAQKLGIREDVLKSLRVTRMSLDARKKNDICFIHTVAVSLRDSAAERAILSRRVHDVSPAVVEISLPLKPGDEKQHGRIIVVGAGPAGLFCAYKLSLEGYSPLLIERGYDVERRQRDVENFWSSANLDPDSNIMFGEGGAGTFSDGKLTTRIKDPRVSSVLQILIENGSPKEIGILAKPHIGTDLLRGVVSSIRKRIQSLGAEVRFGTRLVSFNENDSRITHAILQSDTGTESIECSALVLAIGQGARDTYRLLKESGVDMTPKPFAVGVRIEHPRVMINKSQYGPMFEHPRLGAAEYRVAAQSGSRGVYSFCMCPGGSVIASSSDHGEVVTNGMSYHARDAENSNSALVVSVSPSDYGNDVLDGMRFQQELERRAYELGGKSYFAPCQTAGSFIDARKRNSVGDIKPSYRPGVRLCNLNEALPVFVSEPLKFGLNAFGKQINGFDRDDAMLTAVETRTSAPLRINRNELSISTSFNNLYPVGEGAGYAGGIVSAAVDGLRAAESIVSRYAKD